MGANIFERIQITDKTLYNKGLYALGGLTNFVEIYLDINHKNPQNYRRVLRINEAIAVVNYTHNSVDYSREYFMSYPDKVLVIKMNSNKKGKISFTLRPQIPYLKDTITRYMKTGKSYAKTDLITLSGLDNYLSINYEAQIKVINDGGSLQASNKNGHGVIRVFKANSVLLIIATGTNYKLNKDIFLTKRNDAKLDINNKPHEYVSSLINRAVSRGYDQLKSDHLTDYQNLFSRVSIHFNTKLPRQTTKSLLKAYKNRQKNHYLEELLFQYGRYLLISSSRKGSLPSGLQGVWSHLRFEKIIL